MAIGEAGKHEFSAGVDAFRADAAVAFDFFIAADGLNFSVADGDGLRPGFLRIERVNLGVDDQDLGRREARGLLGEHRRGDTGRSGEQYD